MESKQAAPGFAALAQDIRLDLLKALASRAGAGMAAGDLAATLALPASTLSFHLGALARAGLVASARRGRHVIYTVERTGLQPLAAFLAEVARGPLVVAPAFNVLFLCTRNSARSLMAEAILERLGQGRFRAYSAGSLPAEAPMPEVVDRLRALGHDTSALSCKSWHRFVGPDAPRMDFVIALCDVLNDRRCPDLGAHALTASWPLPDPARFAGPPAERAAMVNELYGMLRRRIEIFVNLPQAALDRLALKQRLDALGDSTQSPP